MLLAILSAFAAALFAPWVYRCSGRVSGWLLAALPCGLAIYFAGFIASVASGDVFVVGYPWSPSLGIRFSFFLDGLSLLFAILISAVGAVVLVYSGGYLVGHPELGRFYAYLLMFMGSMLGLVLADNLITLFVFWELTSLSSYLLIGFDHNREPARAAALQALLVTGAGGLALLAGFLLLAHAGGSMEISTLLRSGEAVRSHPLYGPILVLVLAGAFTKSAQVPFHFWLPGAMVAPTPVSAYLHSATMVKAGVYLLARLSPVLGGTPILDVRADDRRRGDHARRRIPRAKTNGSQAYPCVFDGQRARHLNSPARRRNARGDHCDDCFLAGTRALQRRVIFGRR